MSASVLLIDLGNTRLKWALAAPGAGPGARAGALAWPGGSLPWDPWRSAGVGSVALASVAAPPRRQALLDALAGEAAWPVRQARVDADWPGLASTYAAPQRLGVDRWLALLAALRLDLGTPVLLVSAGSALTVDRLDPGGRHRGGLIAPGLTAMCDGLFAAAPGLAGYGGGAGGTGLANDSADAIASGCLQAALGLIEGQRRGPTGPLPVLLSGGDAARLLAVLGDPVQHRPDLVLEGLAIWAGASVHRDGSPLPG